MNSGTQQSNTDATRGNNRTSIGHDGQACAVDAAVACSRRNRQTVCGNARPQSMRLPEWSPNASRRQSNRRLQQTIRGRTSNASWCGLRARQSAGGKGVPCGSIERASKNTAFGGARQHPGTNGASTCPRQRDAALSVPLSSMRNVCLLSRCSPTRQAMTRCIAVACTGKGGATELRWVVAARSSAGVTKTRCDAHDKAPLACVWRCLLLRRALCPPTTETTRALPTPDEHRTGGANHITAADLRGPRDGRLRRASKPSRNNPTTEIEL